MIQAQPKLTYFSNLDAFRFLSFFGVFLSHTLLIPETTNIAIDFILSVITMNYLGVPFFFTLSSFLITYRLLKEKEKNNSIQLLRFYRNRILRIWPAYFLLVAVCFLVLPFLSNLLHVQSPSLPSIIPFLFFYVNFYIIENGSGFTFALLVLWSISIEEQFYLVWGLVLKFLSKVSVAPVICSLFIISIGFSYYYLYILHKPAHNLAIHSLYVLQNFCTGALIAFICVQKQKAFIFLNTIPAAVLASVYVILPLSYFFIKDIILLNVIKSICYSLIIYDQSFNEKRFFNAGKIAFINYLGKISYGLYLYHALVFVVLQKQFRFFIAGSGPVIWTNLFHTAIAFIVTCVVAHISYRYIESKFLSLKS